MAKFKSFRMVLIRNFIGVTGVVLVLMVVMFNLITGNFIRTEAELEFTRSMYYINTIAAEGMPVFLGANSKAHTLDSFWFQWEQLQSIRQLMLNTDGILINSEGAVLFPELAQVEGAISAEIMAIVKQYNHHKGAIEPGESRHITTGSFDYYIKPLTFPLSEQLQFTFLLYTDVTAVMRFAENINRTLVVLLVLSIIVSTLFSIFISAKLQGVILRLCAYAELVGQGMFSERVEGFPYKEFDDLSKSMNKMSRRLSRYEKNQKEFFQNVSHEMRTPLMSIKGYAEGIKENVLDKEDAVDIILEESEKMEGLVSQLLYISRMDSQVDPVSLSSVNLGQLIMECGDKLDAFASRMGVTIHVSVPKEAVVVETDPAKLQVAIDNVIDNCIRHADSVVNMTLVKSTSGGRVVISDDGDGIQEADLPHIFERFYKGEKGSTGLGLAITKDTLDVLGGQITARNTQKGAEFTVEIC